MPEQWLYTTVNLHTYLFKALATHLGESPTLCISCRSSVAFMSYTPKTRNLKAH